MMKYSLNIKNSPKRQLLVFSELHANVMTFRKTTARRIHTMLKQHNDQDNDDNNNNDKIVTTITFAIMATIATILIIDQTTVCMNGPLS